MNKPIAALLMVAVLGVVALIAVRQLARRVDPKVATFTQQADQLIEGLQGYRKFIGNFPSGSAADIANELSGKSDKKVLVMAAKQENRNQKGEILDPWGNPLQFFFTPTTVLIRSAGPNARFEDNPASPSDDLYRSDAH